MIMLRIRLFIAAAAFAAAPLVALAEDGAAKHIQGIVVGVSGSKLIIQSRADSTVSVHLTDGAKITRAVPASAADLKPGLYVGSTNRSSNEGKRVADEVHILPDAMRGFNEGDHPWDGTRETLMTNGNIESSTNTRDSILTLSFKNELREIAIEPQTQITRFEPGTVDDLKIGNHVMIPKHEAGADGAVSTRAILVATDGLVLNM